ncbi:hypothetical protein H6F67_16375 [Microcoleus sp. FACHB-1515]|uniref:hypothetical protein n=1 Tax=Cyanophyceae TaxID=3028117 RepID=UPI001684E200|nr:hypothetical protein [Microcoleus sp. FACHB-1515]MBD2091420.1 hypothetical protein [Microcoleus sp. FACHB-1515]
MLELLELTFLNTSGEVDRPVWHLQTFRLESFIVPSPNAPNRSASVGDETIC